MKNLIATICLCAILGTMQAQASFVASGMESSSTAGSLSGSVGQVFTAEAMSSTATISAGVQQPYEISVLGIDVYPNINLTMSVYPNPTTDMLNLMIDTDEDIDLKALLFTSDGKLLKSINVNKSLTNISLQQETKGAYLLKVNNNKNQVIKTFKIVKK